MNSVASLPETAASTNNGRPKRTRTLPKRLREQSDNFPCPRRKRTRPEPASAASSKSSAVRAKLPLVPNTKLRRRRGCGICGQPGHYRSTCKYKSLHAKPLQSNLSEIRPLSPTSSSSLESLDDSTDDDDDIIDDEDGGDYAGETPKSQQRTESSSEESSDFSEDIVDNDVSIVSHYRGVEKKIRLSLC